MTRQRERIPVTVKVTVTDEELAQLGEIEVETTRGTKTQVQWLSRDEALALANKLLATLAGWPS